LVDSGTKAQFSEFLKKLKVKDFIFLGLDKNTASKAVKYKLDILRSLDRNVAASLSHDDEKSRIAWDKIITTFLNKIRENSQLLIDANTSVDIFKIVRVPNTIHGGASLISMELKMQKLEKFSPFRDAYPFNKNGNIKIYIEKMPRLKLDGKEYGPYYKEPVELPENIAIYLLAKGAADGVIL
jgi:DNA primase small subunit